MIPFPRNEKELRGWIIGSPNGQKLLQELAKDAIEQECRKCQAYKPNPKVLAVLRRLGRHPGVEVFAEEGVNVRIIALPDFTDDIPAEGLIAEYLPKNWRSMLQLPARRITSDVFTGITLEKAIYFAESTHILKMLSAELPGGPNSADKHLH